MEQKSREGADAAERREQEHQLVVGRKTGRPRLRLFFSRAHRSSGGRAQMLAGRHQRRRVLRLLPFAGAMCWAMRRVRADCKRSIITWLIRLKRAKPNDG